MWGSNWQGRSVYYQYQDVHFQEFPPLINKQQIIGNRFRQKYAAEIIKDEDGNIIKQIRFVRQNRSLQNINFDEIKMHLQDGQLKFNYLVNSMYTIPLSEKQLTNFYFKERFNVIESKGLYISIDAQMDKMNLLIQISKYESDVLNYIKGIKRLKPKRQVQFSLIKQLFGFGVGVGVLGLPHLIGTQLRGDWKPQMKSMHQVFMGPKISFQTFVDQLAFNYPQKQQKFFQRRDNWKKEYDYSDYIHKLMDRPFSFFVVNDQAISEIKISDFFKEKFDSILRVQAQSHLQLLQKIKIKIIKNQDLTDYNCQSIVYMYSFDDVDNIFFEQMLLFSYKKVKLLSFPFKRNNKKIQFNYILLECKLFYLTIDLEYNSKTIIIQIGKQKEKIIRNIRNVNRSNIASWVPQLKLKQSFIPFKRNQSFIYLLNNMANCIAKIQGQITHQKKNQLMENLFQMLKI